MPIPSAAQLRLEWYWAREHVEQPSENPACTWHPRYGWLVTDDTGARSAERQNRNFGLDEKIRHVTL